MVVHEASRNSILFEGHLPTDYMVDNTENLRLSTTPLDSILNESCTFLPSFGSFGTSFLPLFYLQMTFLKLSLLALVAVMAFAMPAAIQAQDIRYTVDMVDWRINQLNRLIQKLQYDHNPYNDKFIGDYQNQINDLNRKRKRIIRGKAVYGPPFAPLGRVGGWGRPHPYAYHRAAEVDNAYEVDSVHLDEANQAEVDEFELDDFELDEFELDELAFE